jgi:hypothetical protein
MRHLLILSFMVSITGSAVAQDGIVPKDAKVELLFDGGVALTEGCASAPDGTIYFSDITFSHVSKDKRGFIEAGHIWKLDPKTKKTSIFRSPSGMSNGIKFDAAGNMIIAEGADHGGRRIIKTDTRSRDAASIPPTTSRSTRRAASTSAIRAIWAMSRSTNRCRRSIASIPTEH